MAHIADVIKAPVLTEKTLRLMQDENKYTFDVDVKANKTEIKQAVQVMFGVKVVNVNTITVKPKNRRMSQTGGTRFMGKTNKRKKAIVTLAEGDSINIFGDEE